MDLSTLPRTKGKKAKRLGRGRGSGRGGHTVGRGTKGQKARGKIGLGFMGTKMKKSLLKRLPLSRGKGKFAPALPGPIVVNLKYLALLPPKSEVTVDTLVQHGLVAAQEAKHRGVKILGEGQLSHPVTVKLPISKSAAAKVVQAGGSVEPT